jgi:HD-like signal output (HDOD) protein
MPVATDEVRATRPWALKILPPFPQVALKLLELLSNDDVPMKKVAELVRLDPAFGAEILRLANSAAYGFRSQIDSLSHAIVLLGTDRVKALTMTVAVGAYGRRAFRFEALRACWHHALATAFLTEELAGACSVNRDRAYTAGLLREIGCLGLLVGYPLEYSNLLAVASEHSMDLLDVERGMFDTDHREAGRWLADEWKFPDELKEVIAEPDGAEYSSPLTLGTLVRMAGHLADALGFSFVKTAKSWTFEEAVAPLPAAARASLPDPAKLAEQIRGRVGAFGG